MILSAYRFMPQFLNAKTLILYEGEMACIIYIYIYKFNLNFFVFLRSCERFYIFVYLKKLYPKGIHK